MTNMLLTLKRGNTTPHIVTANVEIAQHFNPSVETPEQAVAHVFHSLLANNMPVWPETTVLLAPGGGFQENFYARM